VSLTDDDVKHVAKLSAIEINDEEVPALKEQINSILDYVQKLSEIPTKGVEPTFHIHAVSNVFREDVHEASFKSEEIGKIAPDFKDNFFRVPQIIKSNT